MNASAYFEVNVLKVFGIADVSAISSRYLALFTSDPGNDGQSGTEASYTGYARKSLTFAAPTITDGVLTMANSNKIVFPNTSGTTQRITHVALFSASTGGNMLLYGAMTTPVDNVAGMVFSPGSISWTISGDLSDNFKTAIANVLRNTAITKITPYVGLFDGDPRTSGTEVSGGSYARKKLTITAPTSVNGMGYTYPSAAIEFATPTADWGTVTHVAIMQTASSSNIFAVFQLQTPVNILTDDVVTIPADQTSMQLYIG